MGSFEAQVDSFIQVTVFCPPNPRVGAFVYRDAGKVYLMTRCFFSFSLQVLSQIVDFSCKIGEYRELTEKYVISLCFYELLSPKHLLRNTVEPPLTAISLQCPLASVPEGAVVQRFNCIKQPRSQGSLLPVPTERERTWERGCCSRHFEESLG